MRVSKPGTFVFGLLFSTFHPVRGNSAITVADVNGVSINGLLFDAGGEESPVLLEVGEKGHHTSHRDDPIALHDVFFRVGGAREGKTHANLIVNSDDTLIDHTWIWRADHGNGVGWTSNLSDNGLVVNGNDVTAYGLFVEHHQQFQVLWNGERGHTFFYQSEIPYDPPTQQVWTSAAGVAGWASYKVADHVQTHDAFGLGIYSVFRHPDVTLSHAIETPITSHVCFEHVITVALGNLGQIAHGLDNTGAAATTHQPRTDPKVDIYPVTLPACTP